MGEFWEKDAPQPWLRYAIRVYSDEDQYPARLNLHTELVVEKDFEEPAIGPITTWLESLSVSRHRFTYDSVEDFLVELVDYLDELRATSVDAADFLHLEHRPDQPLPYEDLPPPTFPEDVPLIAMRHTKRPAKTQSTALEIDDPEQLDNDPIDDTEDFENQVVQEAPDREEATDDDDDEDT